MDDNLKGQTTPEATTTSEPQVNPTPQSAPPAPPPRMPTTTPQPQPTQAVAPLTPAPTMPPEPDSQVMTSDAKKSKFPIIIGIIVFLNLIIWGFVIYTYFQNKTLKSEDEASETSAVTPTPTEMEITYSFEIDNGSISKVSSLGEKQTLVSKDDYTDSGITGFTFVKASPDETKLCFWSMPPSLSPVLYQSDISGANVSEIASKVTSCTWSNDSGKIAYVNDSALGIEANIYVYDLATQLETQLTESTTSASYRRYSITSWSLDNTSIICSYEELTTATTEAVLEGDCQVEVESGSLLEL